MCLFVRRCCSSEPVCSSTMKMQTEHLTKLNLPRSPQCVSLLTYLRQLCCTRCCLISYFVSHFVNRNLQTLICVLVARPRRCLTLSNPVPWQNWMAAYLGYTLPMRTLFRGWPIMVNDTHTRRRRIETSLFSSYCRFYRRRSTAVLFGALYTELICNKTLTDLPASRSYVLLLHYFGDNFLPARWCIMSPGLLQLSAVRSDWQTHAASKVGAECCGKADHRSETSWTHHTDIESTSLVASQTTSWIQDCQLGIPNAVKQSTWLSGRRYSSRLRKFCSLPQVFFGEKVLCHSCSQSFWWQMFCCSWTTYLEQLTCQSARQGSQLHRIQKTTENIHVSDGLRRIVTFLIIAPYKYSTYLLTYHTVSIRWSSYYSSADRSCG